MPGLPPTQTFTQIKTKKKSHSWKTAAMRKNIGLCKACSLVLPSEFLINTSINLATWLKHYQFKVGMKCKLELESHFQVFPSKSCLSYIGDTENVTCPLCQVWSHNISLHRNQWCQKCDTTRRPLSQNRSEHGNSCVNFSERDLVELETLNRMVMAEIEELGEVVRNH